MVTLGRLCVQKNHKLLVDAFKKIADKHSDVNLLIYGIGTSEDVTESCRSYIEYYGLNDRVHLMGQTMRSQDVLASARCFVLSSDYEGMPNALLEALVVGVPSISTDCPCGGPRTLIENGKNGLLVPVNDVDRLAEAMDKVLSDRDFAEELGRSAKESALKYRREIVFNEWKTFVEDVIYNT